MSAITNDRTEGENRAAPAKLDLRFSVEPEQLERLRSADWMRQLQHGRATSRTFYATCFDTPEGSLRKLGLSLMVSKEGRRFVQTVKSRSLLSRGRLLRREWHNPLKQPEPDLNLVPALSRLADLQSDKAQKSLQHVFRTDIRRTRRILRTPEGGEVSLALDVGEIRVQERKAPLCELRLELLAGPASGLYAIARHLIGSIPARLATQSEMDRGYAFASEAGNAWLKAPPLSFDTSATAVDVLVAAVADCLRHLTANENCVLARAHVEGVHQMRVALRRLRSVITIYKRLLPADDVVRMQEQARNVLRILGPARDWDVFLSEILKPVMTWMSDEASLQAMQAKAERRCEDAYDQVQKLICSPAYTAMLLDFGAWLAGSAWRMSLSPEAEATLKAPAAVHASAILARGHRKVMQAGRGLKTLGMDERHRLRLAVKKQRYAVDCFASFFGKNEVAAYLERMAALQDHLGALNDTSTAERLTRDLAAQTGNDARVEIARAAGLVVGWQQQNLKAHEKNLMRDWKRLKKTATFW